MRRLPFPLRLDYPGAPSDLFRLSFWVVGLSLAVVFLWRATGAELDRKEVEARAIAMHQAESLAASYAAQLDDIAGQMDRLTRALAYAWSEAPDRVDLDRDRIRGLFPDRNEFYAGIVDARGDVVRASYEPKVRANLSGLALMQLHSKRCCAGLLITGPEYGPMIGKHVVRFSRRLEHADGSFAGAVVVAVDPGYLATFHDETLGGASDFITARFENGATLATRQGGGGSGKLSFYETLPDFDARQGVRLEPGERFLDGQPRYVAWRKLDRFPLVAVAGLTEDRVLASFRGSQQAHWRNASIATFCLGLLALAGIVTSLRFALRRRAEEDVRRTYRMATDAANEGFYMLAPIFDADRQLRDFRIEDCNERAAALLGLLRERLVGRRATEAMPEAARAELLALCDKALASGICEDEHRVPANGWAHADWIYRRAVYSGTGIALTLRDISALKAHEQALADIANQDALTQLPNRRWLMSLLPAALQRADRGRKQLALLFIDLDNFKEVNDTLGHEAGDRLLLEAAARVRAAVRASDPVVRLGGDEFTVVIERVESAESVACVAAEVIAALSRPYDIDGIAGHAVSASIGISLWPADGADAETLIKHADVAMYAAKAGGKGRHCFYAPALSERLLRRLGKQSALLNALERDEFVVHYQPRVSAATGSLCSLEALLRWRHPAHGLLMPADFIAQAEESGLIVGIGELVIDKVVAEVARWRDQGLSPVPVSVNVLPRQLQQGGAAERIAHALNTHGLPASLIEIEVTESAMVDQGRRTQHELDALRRLGIRLMIDDFGAGYSSLAQLSRLDVDVLKVDQAFTASLTRGAGGEQMYRAIVSMAAALDMQVVAEGVETVEQLRLLRSIGCDEIQGHVIAPALPAASMVALLRARVLLAPCGDPLLRR
ncbi:MAG: EAL domain-containing protein [Burkholderiaceae bacterium]|nr:EAL domain-containing protein [Burkholderiaceae bacterium]